jgi:hypothetical protein
MDKSNIYFSNGKKIAGKRSMECKRKKIFEFSQREVMSFFTLVTNKGEHSIIYSK